MGLRLLLNLLLVALCSTAIQCSTANQQLQQQEAIAAVQLDFAEIAAADLQLSPMTHLPELPQKQTEESPSEIVIVAKTVKACAFEAAETFGIKAKAVVALLRFADSMYASMAGASIPVPATERLQEVNGRLRRIEERQTEVLSRIEGFNLFSSSMAEYNSLQKSIKIGAKQLQQMRAGIQSAVRQQDMDKLAEAFVTFYDSSDLEQAGPNLYRMATSGDASSASNLFRRVADQRQCSTLSLSAMMLQVSRDFSLAGELRAAKKLLSVGDAAAVEALAESGRQLHRIHYEFLNVYWRCVKDVHSWAKAMASKSLEENAALPEDQQVRRLHLQLQGNFPEFAWAVAASGGGVTDEAGTSAARSWFSVADSSGRAFLIVIGDASNTIQCQHASFAVSKLRFNCSRPLNGACVIASSAGVASSIDCSSTSLSRTKGNAISHAWFAWLMAEPTDTCSRKMCSNKGLCRKHSLLERPICICDEGFAGDSCKRRVDSGEQDLNIKRIAEMRMKIGQLTKVKSIVDVYYKLINVKESFTRDLQSMASCSRLHSLLQQPSMKTAMYVANEYSNLLKSKKPAHEFASLVKTVMDGTRGPHYFLTNLHKLMLGSRSITSLDSDIMSLFKKCLSNGERCSKNYVRSVRNMETNILVLVGGVMEAMSAYYSSIEIVKSLTDEYALRFLKDQFSKLPSLLNASWVSRSCPGLQPLGLGLENWQNRFCDKADTFEGAQIKVKCSDGRIPMSDFVTCVSRPTGSGSNRTQQMQWSSQPQCSTLWSRWSSWSRCSTSCGRGIKRRHRCPETVQGPGCKGVDWQTKRCYLGDCCIMNHGKDVFRCHSNRQECKPRSTVCDGRRDCSDGSDESGCNFLRSGNYVSMHLARSPSYVVNCYCTSRCWWENHYCSAKYCSEWNRRCSDSHGQFHLYGVGKAIGEILYSNDMVGFMYDWHHHNWLSCLSLNGVCKSRNCPGGDVNMVHRSCGGEQFRLISVDCGKKNGCRGRPLVAGKRMAIRHHSGYLAAPGFDSAIKIRNCLSNSPHSRSWGCDSEVWKIFNSHS